MTSRAALIRAGRAMAAVIRGRVAFRSCQSVGSLARASFGRPDVINLGTIEIGARVWVASSYAAVRLETLSGGRLTIGERTGINYGTSITAGESVRIGRGVNIAPYCVISDVEAGPPGTHRARPVVIGDGCWLATRVVVSPGSQIGANTVVTAGTHVEGIVEPNIVYGGAPARVLRRLSSAPADGAVTPPPDGAAMVEPAPAPPAQAERPPPERRALLVADHTVDGLAGFLDPPGEDSGSVPRVAAEVAPFDQTVPTLLTTAEADVVVVWTQPDVALPAMRRVLAGELVTEEALEADVDAFADVVDRAARSFATTLVPTWVLPPEAGGELLDLRPGGRTWALGIVNARLLSRLDEVAGAHVLDAQRWIAAGGPAAFSAPLWFAGKIRFTDAVMRLAAADIRAALATLSGRARKLVVVDLDDTLWGGIVGDVGVEGLRLGGHDAQGEAYRAFQQELLRLKRRGILLAVASKNDEPAALAAIDEHPEMVLRRSDLAGWRIDWNDKARNVVELAAELNLGLQSIVFIDDNPRERARVREALPEVLVPEWPADPSEYVGALAALRCLDQAAMTEEDRSRTEMYVAERGRTTALRAATSIEDWLVGLQIEVSVEPVSTANLQRAAQLLNKTNQMNLATRRLSEEELLAWTRAEGRRALAVSVADRLGPSGLTGLVSVERDGAEARIVDFVLSCRVMGRHVEDVMLSLAAEAGRELGAERLVATLRPTARNAPCQRFFASCPMRRTGETEYELDLKREAIEFPRAIERVA